MIVDPDRYIKTFSDLNAEILTVHFEVCNHLHRSIQEIKNNGMKAGVALNPHTPVNVLDSIIDEIDLVCIMSVNPGFGGQKFIKNTFAKISELKKLIELKKSSAIIEIDGGVTDQNAKELIKAGADVLVAGSFIFKSISPLDTISNLKSITN
jgi:ribulose-phosphate 3-epimerase